MKLVYIDNFYTFEYKTFHKIKECKNITFLDKNKHKFQLNKFTNLKLDYIDKLGHEYYKFEITSNPSLPQCSTLLENNPTKYATTGCSNISTNDCLQYYEGRDASGNIINNQNFDL